MQSTEASNKIEGIYTSDERLKKLLQDKTTPRNRNEQEIAGYRDVLSTIHENFDYIPPKSSMILQLHRDLYKFSGMSYGGSYKSSDNVIAETNAEGNKVVRFQPVPAWETSEAMEGLPFLRRRCPPEKWIRYCSSRCSFWTFCAYIRSMTGTAE